MSCPVWRGGDAGICAKDGEMGKWVEESGHGERIKNEFEKEKPPMAGAGKIDDQRSGQIMKKLFFQKGFDFITKSFSLFWI